MLLNTNNRNNLIVKGARCFQKLPIGKFQPLERLLIPNQRLKDNNLPIIFLLALPRSGSTLIYQSLIHSFQPLYLSNLWNLFAELPYIGSIINTSFSKVYTSDFKSQYGFIKGVNGPSEGFKFWSYWTNSFLDERENILNNSSNSFTKVCYLRSILKELTSLDNPILAGYLGHILIIKELQEWFPSAVFIRLRRDPLSNALSILKARQRFSSHKWFSVLPKECIKYLDSDIYKQTASQVYWLNNRLDSPLNKNKVIDLSYEDFCEDPNEAITNIISKLNLNGFQIKKLSQLPKNFSYKRIDTSSSYEAKMLINELSTFNK